MGGAKTKNKCRNIQGLLTRGRRAEPGLETWLRDVAMWRGETLARHWSITKRVCAFQPSDATEQGSSKQAIWHFCAHRVLAERNHNTSQQTFHTDRIPTMKGLQPRSASQNCMLLSLANFCKGRRPPQQPSSFTGFAYAKCSPSAGSRTQKGGAASCHACPLQLGASLLKCL